jgi:hypothetical protein
MYLVHLVGVVILQLCRVVVLNDEFVDIDC